MDFPLPSQGQPPLSPLHTGMGLWMFWIKEGKKKQMQIDKDPRGDKTLKTVAFSVKNKYGHNFVSKQSFDSLFIFTFV